MNIEVGSNGYSPCEQIYPAKFEVELLVKDYINEDVLGTLAYPLMRTYIGNLFFNRKN